MNNSPTKLQSIDLTSNTEAFLVFVSQFKNQYPNDIQTPDEMGSANLPHLIPFVDKTMLNC